MLASVGLLPVVYFSNAFVPPPLGHYSEISCSFETCLTLPPDTQSKFSLSLFHAIPLALQNSPCSGQVTFFGWLNKILSLFPEHRHGKDQKGEAVSGLEHVHDNLKMPYS